MNGIQLRKDQKKIIKDALTDLKNTNKTIINQPSSKGKKQSYVC
jgi:hypothetical protein